MKAEGMATALCWGDIFEASLGCLNLKMANEEGGDGAFVLEFSKNNLFKIILQIYFTSIMTNCTPSGNQ